MTTSSAVHSQAFGYAGALQGTVDPRTGQYTVAINLPEVKSNWLGGPVFPVSLGFNPINTQDSGYGVGWNLNLTQFTPHNGILALHTGETYKVTGSGATPAIKEKKLDSFHFENLGNDRYRVVHKTGLVEVLLVGGNSNDRVALPVEIYTPAGHCITLAHVSFRGGQRLQSVSDPQGELLRINRIGDTRVEILTRPNDGPDGGPLARYEMNLNASGWVTSIVLPTADKASWRFGYGNGPIRGILCLHEVKTPSGGRETIEYNDTGHPYPGGVTRPNLPRVTRHSSHPGFGQPMIQVDYSYTAKNFLGAGATVTWEDGMDPLYKVATSYEYGSTAKLMNGTAVARQVDRSYNRFHLLSEEKTTQDHCVKRIKTHYHAKDVPFEQQVAQFQLPASVTTTWEMDNDATQIREETEQSVFNEHGNLTEEIDPSGIKILHTYYSKESDPEGFERSVKESTKVPSPLSPGQAPTLRTRFSYRSLAPLAGSGLSPWLVLDTETQLQVVGDDEVELQKSQRVYNELPDNAFLHGRLLSQSQTLNGKTGLTEYQYSTPNGTLVNETMLETIETYTGFDHVAGINHVQKVLTEQHSLLIGQLILSSDGNDMQTLTRYDALGRVSSQTAAPNDPTTAATRHFEYSLTSLDGQQASQVVTDVKGMKTLTQFDGLHRAIYEGRQEAGSRSLTDEYRQTYAAVHDPLGNIVQEITFDWIGEQQLELGTQFVYDSWGQQCRATGPDGVTLVSQVSPFGKEGPITCSWLESTDQPPTVSGLSVSEYNRFGKPDSATRFDAHPLNDRLSATQGQNTRASVIQNIRVLMADEQLPIIGSSRFTYNGHGNSIEQIELLGTLERSTTFEYDVWGRMACTQLPDNTRVSRSYAPHSAVALPVTLHVTPGNEAESAVTIGRQAYDGLLRLTQLNVGPRVENYRYEEGRTQVFQRVTPSNKTIEYEYNLNVSEQPTRIKSLEDTLSYGYDPASAHITHTDNNQGKRKYVYNSIGQLQTDSWTTNEGAVNETHHATSLLGRELSRRHDAGPDSTYVYDDYGRTQSVTQGMLQAVFKYNTSGQPSHTTTKNLSNGHTLVTHVEFDSLGREVLRTLDLTGQKLRTVTQTWLADDQLESRHLQMGDQSLLKEGFVYDLRNRLIQHTCSGKTLPKDSFGHAITQQIFRFDAKDNIQRCTTAFANGKNDIANFTYATDDTCQLKKVTHTYTDGGYLGSQAFDYDADGNMLNDEQGRQLSYDSQGRLMEVKDANSEVALSTYRYDGHNELIGVRLAGQSETLRFYQGYSLSHTLQDGRLTHYLFDGRRPLGQQQADHDQTLLLLTGASPSVIGESLNTELRTAVFSAYGVRSANDDELQTLIAFNGEVRETNTGWDLLGKGYRAYNPQLMRFHSPDSLSPFGEGGINPYVYCLGNPINLSDPTGHAATRNRPTNPGYTRPFEQPEQSWWQKLLPAAGSLLGFLFAAAFVPWTGGASMALYLGVAGALLTAGAVVASVYGAVADDDDALIAGQWLGIAGTVAGFGSLVAAKVASYVAARAANAAVAAAIKNAGGAVSVFVKQSRELYVHLAKSAAGAVAPAGAGSMVAGSATAATAATATVGAVLATGPRGPAGPAGAAGPAGPRGAKGDPGSSGNGNIRTIFQQTATAVNSNGRWAAPPPSPTSSALEESNRNIGTLTKAQRQMAQRKVFTTEGGIRK